MPIRMKLPEKLPRKTKKVVNKVFSGLETLNRREEKRWGKILVKALHEELSITRF
jgi:hypothetical protein